jgi:hypothetical protein
MLQRERVRAGQELAYRLANVNNGLYRVRSSSKEMEAQVRRSIMIALIALLALVVAAPIVYAQSDNGAPPEDLSVTFPPEFIHQFPGHCAFPMQIEISGKIKTKSRVMEALLSPRRAKMPP